MAVVGEVAPLARGEEPLGVAAEGLEGDLGEGVPGQRDEAGDRDPGADPAVRAQHVDDVQGLVRPGEDVEVEGVGLAEERAHAADLDEEAGGQRGEGREPLLDVDPVLAEGDEEVGARVGVDDRLEAELRLAQLGARQVLHPVLAGDG